MRRALFFVVILSLFGQKGIAQNWDIDLLRDINTRNRSSFNTNFFTLSSNSAYVIPFAYPVGCFAMGKIRKDSSRVRESFFSSASLATASLLSYGLKLAIQRPRPYDAYPNQLVIDKPSKTFSFPSGHTTVAFCCATSMALDSRKWYVAVPAYAWACSVAYSRMYLGKHYPTDVIGGIILGAGIPLFFHYCKPVNRWLDKAGKGLLRY
jgi:membrane-associated phospholipid phosphatase